jgi:hypothetical protein
MLTADKALDAYYLEVRCMLLETAATLDRIDLAAAADGDDAVQQDARMQRIYQSLGILADRETTPDRAERLLNLFSEPA